MGLLSKRRILPVLTMTLAMVLWMSTLAIRPLYEPDEGRYAEVPREMFVLAPMKEVIRISALLARHHQHRLARLTALALNRNTVVCPRL